MIELREVHKTYMMGEVAVPVLRGVDLDIRANELLVVLGESGSGKSTLLNLIGGIDSPTSGTIRFDGRDLATMDERGLTQYRRDFVGFVFQFYNLVPTLTAAENVNVAAEVADDPLDPLETLELVGLSKRAGHFPAQLSGGEQQRVAIARALVGRPKIMLCDEPTGALDLETSVVILGTLQRLVSEIETTVLMITHSPPIARLADRSMHLVDGRVAAIEENDAPCASTDLEW